MIEITTLRKRHVNGMLTKRLTSFDRVMPCEETRGTATEYKLSLQRSATVKDTSAAPWEMCFESEEDVNALLTSLIELKRLMNGLSPRHNVTQLKEVSKHES